MVLHPLEFSECYLDSPWFRHSIKEYEDELERTNSQIKQLIKDAKSMLQASRKQGETMQAFSDRLKRFQFEIIGENLTDAERGIAGALKEFGLMLQEIEGEWTRTIERSELQLIQPLENFRKEHIHSYREAKKAFDKTSDRYYKQMEQTLSLSHKKKEQQLLEADNELLVQKRNFHRESLNYVYKLQEVQERKKFEFVEHLLMFMQVYFNFFHQTHETAFDCKDYMNGIQMRLVNTRSQYDGTRDKTQMLMRKMMDNPNSRATTGGRRGSSPNKVVGQRWARAGYLLLLEKNALGSSRFAAKWTRYFCMYTKENKLFQMLPPVTQSSSLSNSSVRMGAINHSNSPIAVDPLIVLRCTRRATDSIDKRFCFDIDVEDSTGKQSTLTLQSLSLEDRKKWLAVMDGKEPNYITTNEYKKPEEFDLNETSTKFVETVIQEIERRGVDAEGIYRLVGVASKVDRLLQIVMDPDTFGNLNYQDDSEWELNTLTSALKNFFRNLPEPIMTFELHEDFINAAKHENPKDRLNKVVNLVAKLSADSQHILKLLIQHLQKVAAQSDVNKMTVQNLGVCFGPTLMRPKQETVQSIMEIKFNNIIVEILIENYSAIFGEEQKEETAHHILKPTVDRLPSQRFKTRPKGILESPGMDKIQEEGRAARNQQQQQHLQPDPSNRFHRGHAIRGPPGRPLSPRSQKKIINAKPESDEESLSSSDNNMDEFGRISPLDLNLNLDHFTLNHGNDRDSSSPPEIKAPPDEPPTKEHRFERHIHETGSGRKPRLPRSPRTSQSERRHSPTERNRGDVYSVVNKKNGNLNYNNCNVPKPGAKSPTVRQRTEKLMESLQKGNSPPSQPLMHKSTIIKRRKTPVKRPSEFQADSDNHNRRPASIDIEKLKEKFSPHEETKTANAKTRPESAGDHSLSFLWPKPGSIKGNTYVETSSADPRPRSTVVSSRDDALSKDSTPDGPAHPDVHELSPRDSLTKNPPVERVFETLFACEAEHESELSFGPGQLIYNVRESEEPGWLVGNLNGTTGLVPENYVRERLWE